MKLVVIGCGGFIGSHLLDLLLARGGYFIEGWDPDDRKITAHLSNPTLRFHRTSITDPLQALALDKAIAGADAVICLAAMCNPSDYNTRPLRVIHSNLFEVYPIIRLCARYRRWLIAFSTSEVYGRTIASYLPDNRYDIPDLFELREDDTPLIMGPVRNQRWTYACAKQMTERLILAHHVEEGLPYTIVRPLNFFGPRMDYIPGRDGDGIPRVLACFTAALLAGKPLQLVDGGRARRTIVSIHDAVEAIRLMLSNPAAAQNQTFNIGNRANEVSIAQLADLMCRSFAEITGEHEWNEHPIEEVSATEFYGEGYEDCDRRMPDLSKAERLLGWKPTIPLREVLDETLRAYYQQYGPRRVRLAPGRAQH